jgi:hypothetical protein
VEEAFHAGAEAVDISPDPRFLNAVIAELKRHLELEDRAFRERRRAKRGVTGVNADPTAATRMSRSRAKAKAAKQDTAPEGP